MKWKGWTNGVLGLWLLLAPFLGLSRTGNLWSDLIAGIIIAVVGFGLVQDKPWQGWTAGFFGLWLIMAAFIPGLQIGAGLIWNNIIVGLIVAAVGFAAAASGKPHQMTGEMHEKMAH